MQTLEENPNIQNEPENTEFRFLSEYERRITELSSNPIIQDNLISFTSQPLSSASYGDDDLNWKLEMVLCQKYFPKRIKYRELIEDELTKSHSIIDTLKVF